MKVAGIEVTEGVVLRRFLFKVVRKGEVIAKELKASSLKLHKENIKEATKGMEAGLMLEDFEDLQADDFLVSYELKDLPKRFKNERVEIDEYDVRDK